MRLGIPRYRPVWALLYCLAFFALLANRSTWTAGHDLMNLALVLLSGGMIVMLAGSVRERREQRAQQEKMESSNEASQVTARSARRT
jgi:hypothetical protein